MDLVDEEHVVFLERRQQSGQVARLVEHRPRRHLEAHAQLVGDDVRERRLAQARRAVQQHMVERLLTHASGHDEHLQVLHHLALAAEAVERERAQGVLIVALRLRRCAGSLAYVEFGHRCVLVTSDELQVTSGTFAQPALGLAAFAVAFAQPAQVLRRLSGRLRSLRKSCGVCRGVCAGCASLAGRSEGSVCRGERFFAPTKGGCSEQKRGQKPFVSVLPFRTPVLTYR